MLGHEGGGIVESIGEGVTDVKVGDHVVPVRPYLVFHPYRAESRSTSYSSTPPNAENASSVNRARRTCVDPSELRKVKESCQMVPVASIAKGKTCYTSWVVRLSPNTRSCTSTRSSRFKRKLL